MGQDEAAQDPGRFQGTVGRTREESTPWWPERASAPKGAPNIVVIYLDDMGFSDLGCFGSEIDTPNIDALAERGLRFNHYTTHPICSPARAALLTGINAHAVSTGWLANNNPGYPGYTGEIPLDAATIAETLRARGYETIMTGKWHNTPTLDAVPSGPKHNWPTQRGFDTFYGFMEGETHYFFPSALRLNNQTLPVDEYPSDYYSTDDWTDRGIQFVKELRASSATKPFFLYIANNAVHAPFQAKTDDLARYRGRYDAGWTAIREARYHRQIELGIIPADAKLAPSDEKLLAWDETDPDDRPLFARHMETYAAMLDCVDQNVGKLVAFLEQIGELDNTIIVFTSDNGATDAGGPTGMVNNNRRYSGLTPKPVEEERLRIDDLGGPRSVALYPSAWGQVCNTPFPTYKTYTGGGGRRVSFIVSWPEKIREQGAIRSQFIHVTDVMPTLLDLAGVEPLVTINGAPTRGMTGRSFAPVLLDSDAPAARNEQYYECWANRAFYRDGWLARSIQRRGEPIDMDNWTLHNLQADFSESVDLRAQHPDRLAALVEAFDAAAWENQVYPLDNRSRPQKFFDTPAWARELADEARTYLPGMQTVIRADVMPKISDRSFRIRVQFSHRETDQGILWALGDPIGGMVAWIERGQIFVHYNGFSDTVTLPGVALHDGDHEVILEYEALGNRQGRGRLMLDGAGAVGWTAMSPTLSFGVFEGLDVGLDRRGPVYPDLFDRHGSFPYTNAIHAVRIEPGARAPRL
ncbi:MAG: arylsulfatase [Chloroflexi bacterium]|nr:arylsulfatase [Chloroflexota bacterium]